MESIASIVLAIILGICIWLIIENVRDEIRYNHHGSIISYLLQKIYNLIGFFIILFIFWLLFLLLVGDLEKTYPNIYNFDWKDFIIKILGIISIIYFSYVFFVESNQREQKKLLAFRILIPLFLGLYLILFY